MSTRFLLVELYVGLLLVVAAHGVFHCVEVVDAGVLPVIRGHIGIRFFVTVTNRGPDTTDIEVKKDQCCEDFPDGQSDCGHLYLITETSPMPPNTTRNFTLIHPTLYPYNRKGECLVVVTFTTSCNRSKEIRQHIAFDTSLNEDNVRAGILRGFPSSAVDSPPCHSFDEDALDECQMVDCHVKYFGIRSFFNKGSRTCEPVPPCLPTRRRGPPDIIYDVYTNTCRNLSCSLGSEDLQHLTHTDLEPECTSRVSNVAAFVNCHHGELVNGSGECRCQPGYVNAEMPREPGNPRTQVFHTCNVIGSCWHLDRLFALPPRSILLTSFLLALLLALFCFCIIREC